MRNKDSMEICAIDRTSHQVRMRKLFTEGFTVLDIAEPLRSFDHERSAGVVKSFMSKNKLEVIGIRKCGEIAGYVNRADLRSGRCGAGMNPFDEASVVDESASLAFVIECLARCDYCFAKMLGAIGAVVTRNDIEKPPVRMWLFGMITIVEIYLNNSIESRYPNLSWKKELSPGRLKKAQDLYWERKRRKEPALLMNCLQLNDKAHILLKDPEMRRDFGVGSKREGEATIKAFVKLRNHLAHSEKIISHNWDAIVDMSRRLDRIMTRI